jgi:hypothetical protein
VAGGFMLEEIDKFLNAEPFSPFQITLTSGHSYAVRYPAMIVVGKDLAHFYHPHSDFRSVFRLNQIAALDMID